MQWEQLWLQYNEIKNYQDKEYFSILYQMDDGYLICNAVEEMTRAAKEMFARSLVVTKIVDSKKKGIILQITSDTGLGEEGYAITKEGNHLVVSAYSQKGILYGVFHLIRQAKQKEPLTTPSRNIPANKHRMLNHWDDFNGDIERGYSGKSFFFANGKIIVDERIVDYARLLASIGINEIVINNVNVRGRAGELITSEHFLKLKEMAEIFEGYGVKLFLSINFAATIEIGGLQTADPLAWEVQNWWQERAKIIYDNVPNFGGFLVKADSEGRPGPFTYGRSHADGANMLAAALKPYEGIVIWRCFVYNCKQDWRDTVTDRARAAYDNFIPFDGQFADNVVLQIKNGPMDFQVREPISPLFGALRHTNQFLEVQIAQEYTGQQIDVCYLLPMWKEVLKTRTYCQEKEDTVADIITGRTFGNANGCKEYGIAAVTNTGNDKNWTGHDLAAANLYGFGRLAWDLNLNSEDIAKEWITLTFGADELVQEVVLEILMMSWEAYENYTSPLGIGWMVNPSHHYGPNVDGYEYDVWGTYHRANHAAIGVDRSSRGTGQAQQYLGENAKLYDNIETCPEELLLFFHRVPYTYQLKSGKTLIQHIYDTHFTGVKQVEQMIKRWDSLQGKIDAKSHRRVQERFMRQLENSRNWRDQVNTYFYRKTLIADEKGRKIYE